MPVFVRILVTCLCGIESDCDKKFSHKNCSCKRGFTLIHFVVENRKATRNGRGEERRASSGKTESFAEAKRIQKGEMDADRRLKTNNL